MHFPSSLLASSVLHQMKFGWTGSTCWWSTLSALSRVRGAAPMEAGVVAIMHLQLCCNVSPLHFTSNTFSYCMNKLIIYCNCIFHGIFKEKSTIHDMYWMQIMKAWRWSKLHQPLHPEPNFLVMISCHFHRLVQSVMFVYLFMYFIHNDCLMIVDT